MLAIITRKTCNLQLYYKPPNLNWSPVPPFHTQVAIQAIIILPATDHHAACAGTKPHTS